MRWGWGNDRKQEKEGKENHNVVPQDGPSAASSILPEVALRHGGASKPGPGAEGRVLEEVQGGAERLAAQGRGGGRPGLTRTETSKGQKLGVAGVEN